VIERLRNMESAGWGVYLVMLVIFSGPGIYLSWQFTYEHTSAYARVAVGILIASVFAGFITYGINEILHRRNIRRYNEQRKAERKQKKKQKKKKG